MFNLSPTRLCALVAAFPALRIGVVGDFFLDSYLECDPALDEKSLETGKTCYQVIGYRRQPGAAGNVAANLRALGVGAVEAVGYCGDDGEGLRVAAGHASARPRFDWLFHCSGSPDPDL